MGRDPRRRDGRRRPDRPARPPRDDDRAQGQELPPARARPRRHARRSGSVAPRLRLNGGSQISPTQARIAPTTALSAKLDATVSAPHALRAPSPSSDPDPKWCTFRLRKLVHFSAALDRLEPGPARLELAMLAVTPQAWVRSG